MEPETHLPRARDFMNPSVRALPAHIAIDEALALLARHGHSGAPVLGPGGRVVGVFSEMDGLRVLASAAFHGDPTGTVADHMTRSVASISPDADLFAVVELLQRTGHRRLPVVLDGHLVGLVTVHDADAALRRLHATRQPDRRDHPPGAAWDPRQSAERDRRAS